MRNIFTHLRASLFPLLWVFIFSSVVESALNISGSYDMGRAIFDQKCAPCHTIGGCKKIGPDLRGVTERRKRDWLIRWLDNHGGEGHLDGWTIQGQSCDLSRQVWKEICRSLRQLPRHRP